MTEYQATPSPLLDREASVLVARRIRAQYRRCWRNAAVALSHLGSGAVYAEGWIVVERAAPLVIEHGWCETAEGIIDPTYTPYVSNLEEPLAYFPGMQLQSHQVSAALRRGSLPITWLRDAEGYRSSFEAAVLYAKSRRGSRLACPATRVVHCRKEPFDVFIGRPTIWGNPFRIGVDGDRAQVMVKFREWFIRRPALLRAVENLRGRILGCFCAPELCHGDVLAELADLGEVVEQADPVGAARRPLLGPTSSEARAGDSALRFAVPEDETR